MLEINLEYTQHGRIVIKNQEFLQEIDRSLVDHFQIFQTARVDFDNLIKKLGTGEESYINLKIEIEHG